MPNWIIRTFKGWNNREFERSWSNTYEMVADDISPVGLQGVAVDIIEAEAHLHLPAVQFLGYTISTWNPDGVPYDPTTFKSVSLARVGLRAAPNGWQDQALDYNVCLMVHRNCETGRTGRLYYRGCLGEWDVKMGGSGRFQLAATGEGDVTYHIEAGAWTLFLAGIGQYVNPEAVLNGHLALISDPIGDGNPPIVRPVESLEIGGVVINKKNHRYFDRAP